MRTIRLWWISVLVAGLCWGQDNLIDNGDFTAVEGDPPAPSEWTADPAARERFEWVNVDGYDSNESIQVKAGRTERAPRLVQEVSTGTRTQYVLTAALKGQTGSQPLVQALHGATGDVLAELRADPAGRWTRQARRFSSRDAESVRVVLTVAGEQAGGAVDAVGLYPADQAPADLENGDWFAPPGRNIALGKSYTMQPTPRYSFCSDEGDVTQLTDGVHTSGYFWTQETTVGWQRANPVVITVDLGAVQPIAGASFNTAAGVAGVTWPFTILVLVSDDGNAWYQAGELVRATVREQAPPAMGYAVHRFAAKGWQTKGRYVKFMVGQSPYSFCDEIEVYEGDAEWLSLAHTGQAFPAGEALTEELFVRPQITAGVEWRLRTDLAAVVAALDAASLPAADKRRLLAGAERLGQTIDAMPEAPLELRTILPLNDLHRAVLALHAPVLRARGYEGLTPWKANRWDALGMMDAPAAPPAAAPSLEVVMMRGEVRADAVNLTNATDESMTVTLTFQGLPGGITPDYLSVRDVLFTDTRSRTPVAAALPEAERTAAGWRVSIPAGTTKQVWLSVEPPRTMAGGTLTGALSVEPLGAGDTLDLPVSLRIVPIDYPEEPTLAIGGWDYTNGSAAYYRAPGNLESLLALFREYDVNTPWATRSVAPSGMHFADDGRLQNPDALNFHAWDDWVQRWDFARNYCVFLSVGDRFEGEPMGTPRFNRMVGDWFRAWAAHAREQDIDPVRISVLLVDEPHRNEQDEIIIAWARAIQAADTGIRIFEDPTYRDPTEGLPEMYQLSDILCPNTPMMMAQGKEFRDFYLQQKRDGRTLWLYSCSGPAKELDPCVYHRGQMWWAAQMGATGTFYWALGCGGRIGDSWRAYAQGGVEYSPFFVGQTEVTRGKHMEGVREGVQDYEYVVMLRDRVNAMQRRGQRSPLLSRAEKMLVEGPRRVTATLEAGSLSWFSDSNHTVMDQVRTEMLEILTALQEQ